MKIILDENLPKYLKKLFQEHSITTVQEEGWAGMKNGELIKIISQNFEVFITADKNLKYQQNIQHYDIAIIQIYTNRLPLIKKIEKQILYAIKNIKVQQYIEINSD